MQRTGAADTSATRHFGNTRLVPKCSDTSTPSLSRITSRAEFRRNCPGSEVSRLFLDPVTKCLVAEVSGNRR